MVYSGEKILDEWSNVSFFEQTQKKWLESCHDIRYNYLHNDFIYDWLKHFEVINEFLFICRLRGKKVFEN